MGKSDQRSPRHPSRTRVAQSAVSSLSYDTKDAQPRSSIKPRLTSDFAEIERDLDTGKCQILEMVTVAECGTELHPQVLDNQIRGGNVMGIGLARLERHIYDPKRGLPAAALLYQARPPRYLDLPAEIRWGAGDKPEPQNPVGVKGGGEPGQSAGATA